ncbi:MAG: ABC transporter ATP-binding protein [Lachnospiraceae bacterium]|nr:ABC transporter ATP-binding protein [Lachnospiraceae bacterium]
MKLLELEDVYYTYKTKYQSVEALKGITYAFEEGLLYAVMGSSGSGKTTLLSLMAGLDTPASGRVLCEGTATDTMDLARYRREMTAVIYQDFRLFPLLTAAENIMYPMELRGIKKRDAREEAGRLLCRVGLSEDYADRFPAMLSGGEQQRVAIARALGMQTRVLLADEPTGNLDETNSENIFRMLLDLAHKEGYLVIVVTHDENLGAQADVRIRIRDGRISESTGAQ